MSAILPSAAAWTRRSCSALSNTTTYVLDRHLRPVPIGVIGELFLGGEGVARDYLHRPELTAEKFIPDPFGLRAGARLYKTGDLVRMMPDGTIEFVGRQDFQVKIRGFRIEPAEQRLDDRAPQIDIDEQLQQFHHGPQ